MVVALLLVVLFLGTFVVRPFSISSISMIPTLHVGDTVLVDVATYHFRAPRFGDIAIFMPPIPSRGLPYVKRVIGIPGDRIRIAEGVLYRNGDAVAEPYVNEPPRYDLSVARDTILVDDTPLDPTTADIPPRRVWRAPNRIPAGFYLVLGDNRNYSDDSHLWGFARFARARFIGRAIMVLWPPSHLRFLH
jgi:signal peptidase I